MENQTELNRKLIEFAGFEYRIEMHYGSPRHVWIYPDGTKRPSKPDFPHSLDLCFQWLEPKLRHYELQNWDSKGHTAYAGIEKGRYKIAKADTPALALCRATEKLIDGSEK